MNLYAKVDQKINNFAAVRKDYIRANTDIKFFLHEVPDCVHIVVIVANRISGEEIFSFVFCVKSDNEVEILSHFLDFLDVSFCVG